MASAPNRLRLVIDGRDADETTPGYAQDNSIDQEFDLTQYPGRSVTIPFTLQSKSLRERTTDLHFDVSGRIEITRH